MSSHWFYVENKDKVGPVGQEKIIALIKEKKLVANSYLWTTGLDNWKKLLEIDSLKSYLPQDEEKNQFDWHDINPKRKVLFIMTGKDRGEQQEAIYGPYSLEVLTKLYKEKRINGRSYIWTSGLKNWKILADIDIFEQSFGGQPPEIEEIERRTALRKPFIARILFNNQDQLYEGICRDVSIGGMQILISGHPAQPGDRISCNVHPDNSQHHFVADGEVVRLLGSNQGFSFRFIEIGAEAKAAIADYINSER